ncbi:hypothetical protein OH76DRAFT_1013925 [Lentinus brumalis]|uniref:Uncharacterized protein n=1 Tax=Lentinus brumalis TaxID=2498619 RepID=A0A371CYF2_9APHY|nr:hypothetical protein OH76DRAFT_1013925 [Polyporus brumalis]
MLNRPYPSGSSCRTLVLAYGRATKCCTIISDTRWLPEIEARCELCHSIDGKLRTVAKRHCHGTPLPSIVERMLHNRARASDLVLATPARDGYITDRLPAG